MAIDLTENVSMAVRTLRGNKLRSGLTMLGIVIGNASVIAMIAVGQGAQQFIGQQFETLGSNVLFILPGIAPEGPLASAAPAQSLVLSDAVAIANEVPAVEGVAPEKTARFQVTWADKDTQVEVTGTTTQYTNVRNATVARGQFFSHLELEQHQSPSCLAA